MGIERVKVQLDEMIVHLSFDVCPITANDLMAFYSIMEPDPHYDSSPYLSQLPDDVSYWLEVVALHVSKNKGWGLPDDFLDKLEQAVAILRGRNDKGERT